MLLTLQRFHRNFDIVHQSTTAQQDQLIWLVRHSAWLMSALMAVRELHLESWCIGAGAVRNLVWDSLHGYTTPSALADVDVAYFDSSHLSSERDIEWQLRLAEKLADTPWEITNQAGVHLWFERYFGHPVAPLASLAEAVGTWPEYATSVGVTLLANDTIEVISPHGLDDLFGMVVQRNPTRVSVETYRQRVIEKRYAERWPKVTVLPA